MKSPKKPRNKHYCTDTSQHLQDRVSVTSHSEILRCREKQRTVSIALASAPAVLLESLHTPHQHGETRELFSSLPASSETARVAAQLPAGTDC